MTQTIGRIAKFLTALAGAAAQAVTLGLATGTARSWLTVAIGVLTAAAVYLVPNQPAAVATLPPADPIPPVVTGGGVTGVAPTDLIGGPTP
jgi:hypothetical protein